MSSTLATILGLTCLPASILSAQGTPDASRTPRVHEVNDRTIADLLGGAIVEKSSSLFMRAAREGIQVPLEVTLPSGATSDQWQAFRDHLMMSLRGRSPQTHDNLKHIVGASLMTIGRDTIRAAIDIGIRRRCHGQWIADGNTYEITWILYGDTGWWKRSRNEMQIAYDSFGCPVDP